MKLKPWYDVVKPRADLRTGQSLDTSEFAVHLDMVHHQQGDALYWKPEQFFARTYLTRHLLDLSAEVVRRLSGNKVATSPVFNMTTQFGGGKTHALTLLYHLAQHGPASHNWPGVARILDQAGVTAIPQAQTAIFVGQRFDPRGGDDGTPLRRTPWAEIAWQLAGEKGVAVMSYFDEQGIAPGGDTIRKLFALVNRPILILMDELINYVSRYRQSGLGGQFYNFLQNLSEEARAHDNVVLAVSIPASEYEMTLEDQDDYRRMAKLLDRVGKAVLMSAETDTAEIIRRRLFDWDEWTLDSLGRVILKNEAMEVCKAYAAWVVENRRLLPTWFPVDNALDLFKATYPFHPVVLSVFERKWQSLPGFQRTRGILRLLALWISHVYQTGFRDVPKDPLIELGTAPFEGGNFRAALFKQLNEERLESAIMTDIAGQKAHAMRLDSEANATLKRARLHRKVATTIFFESNGGQTKDAATLAEIRLAVGHPDLDIGNVETVLEALAPPDGICYYLDVVRNQYRFDWKPNLLQILSDRKANVSPDTIDQLVRSEVERQFGQVNGVDVVTFLPERTIRNQPVLSIAVLPPEYNLQEKAHTLSLMERLTQEHGASARTFKSAIIWAVADQETGLREAARKHLAWESIDLDRDELQLNETQKEQVRYNLSRGRDALKDAVWQSYRQVYLLGKDNTLRPVDLGRHNSSSATNLTQLILRELRRLDDVAEVISANFLVRNWPPAFTAWSTKMIRDAFYASPQFPRLVNGDALKETIARGVTNGQLAYVGKVGDQYHPFYFRQPLNTADVEITEAMYVLTPDTAEAYLRAQAEREQSAAAAPSPPAPVDPPLQIREPHTATGYDPTTPPTTATPTTTVSTRVDEERGEGRGNAAAVRQIRWSGEIPAQKWGNFYMNVLAKFANRPEWRVRLRLHVDITSSENFAGYKVEEMKTALRDMGLSDQVETE